MRDELLDLLERLVSVHEELGERTFDKACRGARLAIAQAVLADVEARVGAPVSGARPADIQHRPLTI